MNEQDRKQGEVNTGGEEELQSLAANAAGTDDDAIGQLLEHREHLLESRATPIRQMQESLDMLNIKLTNVVDDITSRNGMAIVNAILPDPRNPNYLAQ